MRMTDKIIGLVGWDKALHFVAGFAIACCAALVCACGCGMAAWRGAVIGFFLASAAGLAKELLDTEADWLDLLATALGALAALIVAAVL